MLLAVALGVLVSNGQSARVEVSHKGSPVPVEIIGLNEAGEETQVTALPSRLRVGNGRKRTVRVQFTDEITALCAVYSSPSFKVRSCSAQLNLQAQRSGRTGTSQGGYQSILQRALDALQQEPIEPLLRLPAPTTTTPPSMPAEKPG